MNKKDKELINRISAILSEDKLEQMKETIYKMNILEALAVLSRNKTTALYGTVEELITSPTGSDPNEIASTQGEIVDYISKKQEYVPRDFIVGVVKQHLPQLVIDEMVIPCQKGFTPTPEGTFIGLDYKERMGT